jgi:hypothetical protein
MAEKQTSNCPAQAIVDLSPEQIEKIKPFVEQWQNSKGLVIGSLGEHNGDYRIGFRQVPTETGKQIIRIVDEYYEGEKSDVNS